MTIRAELLDELLKDFTKPEDLVGEGGIFRQLTKALVERCRASGQDPCPPRNSDQVHFASR